MNFHMFYSSKWTKSVNTDNKNIMKQSLEDLSVSWLIYHAFLIPRDGGRLEQSNIFYLFIFVKCNKRIRVLCLFDIKKVYTQNKNCVVFMRWTITNYQARQLLVSVDIVWHLFYWCACKYFHVVTISIFISISHRECYLHSKHFLNDSLIYKRCI